MDYSKFLDEGFDVKEWVNAAFRANKESSQDQYATTLVMKLQMFIQEVNNVIEESCQQAVNNLPRVMRELEAVKQEAVLLQEQMKMVKYDIEKVEHDTAQSMQTLLRLDSVKTRMKAASEALQEADNWTTLSDGVDDVYESGDVCKIAEKLVGLQQSLTILTDVPDYAERCQYLETLKNRLEALLSPQVVAAFSAQSLESAQTYVKIFSDIERLPQLHKYYNRCHKGKLQQQWRDLHDAPTEFNLPRALSDFYDKLLSLSYEQIKWCSQVFDCPALIVCDLLTETLNGLDPSLVVCVERHLDEKGDSPVNSLIQLKQITERFAKSLESTLESHGQDTHKPQIEQLASAIYAPYKPFVAQYANYEAEALSTALDNIRLDHEEVLDSVNLLAESVTKLFNTANQATERCVQLTNGCGFIKLPDVLTGYFRDYVKEFKRVVVNIKEKSNTESPSVDAHDWSTFQNALRIIQTCGDLILHTQELDQVLISNIVSSVEKFCPPPSPTHADPLTRQEPVPPVFHNYKLLLLETNTERQMLEALVASLEEGDESSLLGDVHEEMHSLSAVVHQFAFDTVFAPLQHQLMDIPNMEIWQSESQAGAITTTLPAFGLSPQEYITKVGQYLMTLPQQLDPFTMEDSPTLSVALKYGKLPYTAEQTDLPEHLADLWLESVARGIMHVYSEQILKIHQLSSLATQQLITDIDYLTNVLDDLGLQSSDTLGGIITLLRAPQEEYADISENMPQRLSSAIAHIRDLTIH